MAFFEMDRCSSNFRSDRILMPVFMFLRFIYFVDNTAKCVSTFFGRTT